MNVCEDCEKPTTNKKREEPFIKEINNKIILKIQCDECYHNSCMEI